MLLIDFCRFGRICVAGRPYDGPTGSLPENVFLGQSRGHFLPQFKGSFAAELLVYRVLYARNSKLKDEVENAFPRFNPGGQLRIEGLQVVQVDRRMAFRWGIRSVLWGPTSGAATSAEDCRQEGHCKRFHRRRSLFATSSGRRESPRTMPLCTIDSTIPAS